VSTENLVPTDTGAVASFPPHVMFYAPYLTNADIGSDGNPGGPVFVAAEGTPHANCSRWSSRRHKSLSEGDRSAGER
jgi:hypothetical protein